MNLRYHECKRKPDFLILYDYKERNQWKIYDDRYDSYINKINYCPFCGVRLEK